MGKYKKGVLGSFRGKVGTVIGAIWNGIAYMRSLPEVSPNRKPTPAQLNRQLIFTMITAFLKPLKNLINIGYQKFDKGQSPMNAATSYHLKHAVTGTAPDYAVNYENVVYSVGDLEAPSNAGISTNGQAKVVFEWKALSSTDLGKPTDKATFMVYSPALKKFVILQDAAARTALTFTLQMPAAWVGNDLHCYMSFTSLDGKKASNSVYLGKVPLI